MGLGTGGLFLPSIARAGSEPPRRFLLFYTSQGCVPDRWNCNPFANPLDQDWQEDWTLWSADEFSDSLRSLQPWAKNCAAVGGLAR